MHLLRLEGGPGALYSLLSLLLVGICLEGEGIAAHVTVAHSAMYHYKPRYLRIRPVSHLWWMKEVQIHLVSILQKEIERSNRY